MDRRFGLWTLGAAADLQLSSSDDLLRGCRFVCFRFSLAAVVHQTTYFEAAVHYTFVLSTLVAS